MELRAKESSYPGGMAVTFTAAALVVPQVPLKYLFSFFALIFASISFLILLDKFPFSEKWKENIITISSGFMYLFLGVVFSIFFYIIIKYLFFLIYNPLNLWYSIVFILFGILSLLPITYYLLIKKVDSKKTLLLIGFFIGIGVLFISLGASSTISIWQKNSQISSSK